MRKPLLIYSNKLFISALLFLLLLVNTNLGQADSHDKLNDVKPQIRINSSADDNHRTTLTEHRLAILDHSTDKGRVEDQLMLRGLILHLKITPVQESALEAFNTAQQTPGSNDYHRWLTPEEFASHFGVANEDISAIKNYLLAQGFSVEMNANNNRDIVFSGTAGQIRNTFHTEIHHIVWQGEKHIANTSNPQIPAAFADVIDGLINLHDFHSRSHNNSKTNKNPAIINNSLYNNNTANYSIFPITDLMQNGSNQLTPGDLAVIYDINPLYISGINGSGYSIAVLGRSNINSNDISNFQNFVGLANRQPQTIITNNDPGLVNGDQTESSLDLEWAMAIATGATIKFITSSSTTTSDGITSSAMYAVNNNIGDIISLSYSACESLAGYANSRFWNNLWKQAQTQGQTVLVSSGDSGAAGCDFSNSSTATHSAGVNALCSSQYSTCVGGTEFIDTNNTSQYWLSANPSGSTTTALRYIPEQVWNESGSNLYASGGGLSIYWNKPSWQVAPGVPSDGKRDVPDIALSASVHDGYLIYINGSQQIVGGTSASTPAMAGIVALLLQFNGGRQGNINPTLYQLFQLQSSGSYSYFHTTVSGNNSVPGLTGYTANGTGYNLATGLGSVDANLLIRHWQDYNNIHSSKVHAAIQNATSLLLPVTTSINLTAASSSINSGQNLNLTVKVYGDNPTGSVQFVANGVSLGSATLNNGVANFTSNNLSIGSNSVVAIYAGDGNNLISASSPIIETVLAMSTVVVSSSSSTTTTGSDITLTATVTGNSPSGTIQFFVNGQAVGSLITLVNGVASYTTAFTSTGQDIITAIYSGDNLNTSNSSAPFTETITASQSQQVPSLSIRQLLALALLLLLAIIYLPKRFRV